MKDLQLHLCKFFVLFINHFLGQYFLHLIEQEPHYDCTRFVCLLESPGIFFSPGKFLNIFFSWKVLEFFFSWKVLEFCRSSWKYRGNVSKTNSPGLLFFCFRIFCPVFSEMERNLHVTWPLFVQSHVLLHGNIYF